MKEHGMHVTASGKKTTEQPIGTVWEFAFKVDPIPESDNDQHHPVQVRINRPDQSTATVVPALDGKTHKVTYALDLAGEHNATVIVTEADDTVSQLGGFTATATEVDAAVAGAPAQPVDPATDEPDPEPADAA